MAKIEILILEDDLFEIELLKESLDENYLLYFAQTEEEALEVFSSKPSIDLVILDVYINGKQIGLNVADFIHRETRGRFPIIFLTSATDKALFQKAIQYSPASYLIKPFNKLELIYSLELAIENCTSDEHNFSWTKPNGAVTFNQHLLIRKRKSWVKVAPREILFVEVEGRYCKLVTDKGEFLIQTSLSKYMKTLDPSVFTQTHRNYAVNISRVKEYATDNNLITLDNDKSIFLSSRLKENFLKHYRVLK